jgi:hypothetical protein
LSKTRTKAILSSLSNCSMGVSFLYFKGKLRIKITFYRDLNACLCLIAKYLELKLAYRQGNQSTIEQLFCIFLLISSIFLIVPNSHSIRVHIRFRLKTVSSQFLQAYALKSLLNPHLLLHLQSLHSVLLF